MGLEGIDSCKTKTKNSALDQRPLKEKFTFQDKEICNTVGNDLQLVAILLQVVMVSPWTHLVKNHEPQSRTIVAQFKKTRSPWVFCKHTANLKINSRTLFDSLLKQKDTPSIVKHKKD